MNNNIKETTSLVFVKGKNLYNKNSNFGNVLIDENGVATVNNVWTCSNNIKVKGNTEYTLSWTNINGQPQIEICEYKEDGTFIGNNFQTLNAGVTFYTMTLNSNTDFVKVAYRNDRQDNVQFEQGPATPYQLYVEKQIHIKNKNDVFEEFLGENAIIPFNLSVNYTSDVQNCFAVDNIVNINLNTFNSNGFTRDAWTIIATIPAGFRPSKVVYMSAYGSDGGWNSPVAVPVMINTSGEILVFLKTTVKRILISSSYLQ